MTEKLLKKLIKNGLDKVLVTNYDNLEKKDILKLSQKYPNHVIYRTVKDMHIANRAGALFDKENKKIDEVCLRPSNQLVVNWKGNVLLCCNDYYEKYVFGNVKDEPILKIWNNDKFKKYREILKMKGGRKKINICKNCDF